jgi:predicted CXXCH cytochrome family protein
MYSIDVQADSSSIQLGDSCVDTGCHTNFRESQFVHGPVLLEHCNMCHETVEDRHLFKLTNTGVEMCTLCHKMKFQAAIHEPVIKGECLKCHDPHRSALPSLIKTATSGELCFTCHQETETLLSNTYLHAPVAKGDCILCHTAHSANTEQFLISEGTDLCLSCHMEELDSQLELEYLHRPVVEDCEKCHDSHSAENPMLTLKDQPEICYDCHQDIARIVETSSNVHEGALQEKSCSNCHAAHASSYSGLLVNNSYDLCLSCHDEEIQRPDGTVIENIARVIEENPYRHGPVVQKNCVACHDPHGSELFSFLVSPYPEKFYSPFDPADYGLCFKCHLQDIFLKDCTTTLTNFRDGDVNLHFLHVNKDDKGRTCRACHETHASSQKAHIRSAVPYGDWEIPVVFESDDFGGTCLSGCHEEQRYSREYTPVEVREPLVME